MIKVPQTLADSNPQGAAGFFKRRPAGIGAVGTFCYFLLFGLILLPYHDSEAGWHFNDFGELPVIDQGRFKPLDTTARMSLMLLTHRQDFYDVNDKTTYPATKWYLDVATVAPMFNNGGASANDLQVFRVENDQLQRMLKLQKRESMRYSLDEIMPEGSDNERFILGEVKRLSGDEERDIAPVDPKDYSLLDAKLMELWEHILIYKKIAGHSAPLVIPDPEGTDQWKSLGGFMNEFIARNAQVGDGIDSHTFRVYLKLLELYGGGGNADLTLAQRQAQFNSLLTQHLAELNKQFPDKMRKVRAEIFFSQFKPFYLCLAIYVLIAVFTAISWFTAAWGPSMRTSAFAAMAMTFAFHTAALVMRMYIQNRPPVTNLYSSAVFIGWGCVLMSLIVEWIYKDGIATVVGSVLGFLTLIIAHLLSFDGDTMIMMVAVLDTNFWLATHVTCVTLGYMTVFVAGFMGVAYILLGVFTDKLRGQGAADLTRMIYGVLCTGMFLSFVGTVLGGLWADYSWGRFWGWDPKENGALLIVIWVALILHARWGGMVKQRGIAILAVLGIIVTGWSWFGTNFLGVGLHAYGGSKGSAMLMMVLIDFIFLGVAALGLLPLQHWQSFLPPSKMKPPSLPPAPPTGIKPATMGV